MTELSKEQRAALSQWSQRGYHDAIAGRTARHPLRDDNQIAADGYASGYRIGKRERERRAVEA